MFSDEVLGLPQMRDTDFTINYMPREARVSKAPYKMNTHGLVEMKM